MFKSIIAGTPVPFSPQERIAQNMGRCVTSDQFAGMHILLVDMRSGAYRMKMSVYAWWNCESDICSPVAGFCGQGNEPSDSINVAEFIGQLTDFWLPKGT